MSESMLQLVQLECRSILPIHRCQKKAAYQNATRRTLAPKYLRQNTSAQLTLNVLLFIPGQQGRYCSAIPKASEVTCAMDCTI